MKIRVRLFAALRETVGAPELELEVPEGARAEDVWAALVLRHPDLTRHRQSLGAAVNQRYVAFDAVLVAGDEVVFVPPVAGGCRNQY